MIPSFQGGDGCDFIESDPPQFGICPGLAIYWLEEHGEVHGICNNHPGFIERRPNIRMLTRDEYLVRRVMIA